MVVNMAEIGSNRMKHFSTGIFAELNEKREKIEKQGKKLYNLFVGTPDFPPAPHIMEAVQKSAANPEDYKYSLKDLPELLDAVVDYYNLDIIKLAPLLKLSLSFNNCFKNS